MNPYTTISFPALGIEWNPGQGFDIGPLSVRYYGLIIAIGLLLAVIYAWKRCHQFGITQDDLTDGVLWIVPFAILCARLYYCVFEWDQYKDNPISILYIWQGGLAIYGGVLGAIAGICIFCKIKKIKIGAVLDIVALGFLIGQCIGRWGNFFNREAFGHATDCFMKMGLFNSLTGAYEYYHPTFLYESVWNLAGFLILHFLSKKRQYDGQIALGYAVWYGFGRAVIEGLRTDSLYWGSFRVSQVLAAVSCLAGAAVLVIMTFRTHDKAKLFVSQVAAARAAKAAEEAEAAAEGTEAAEDTAETAADEVSLPDAPEAEASEEPETPENN